jgi:hypothetical protein
MIVKEMQYKLKEDLPWEDLDIQPGTGTFDDSTADSPQGQLTTSQVKVYLPESYPEELKPLVLKLLRAGAIFSITVNGDTTFRIGTDELRTQFLYKQIKADKPGGKCGYDITITWKSLNGSKLAVL